MLAKEWVGAGERKGGWVSESALTRRKLYRILRVCDTQVAVVVGWAAGVLRSTRCVHAALSPDSRLQTILLVRSLASAGFAMAERGREGRQPTFATSAHTLDKISGPFLSI